MSNVLYLLFRNIRATLLVLTLTSLVSPLTGSPLRHVVRDGSTYNVSSPEHGYSLPAHIPTQDTFRFI